MLFSPSISVVTLAATLLGFGSVASVNAQTIDLPFTATFFSTTTLEPTTVQNVFRATDIATSANAPGRTHLVNKGLVRQFIDNILNKPCLMIICGRSHIVNKAEFIAKNLNNRQFIEN